MTLISSITIKYIFVVLFYILQEAIISGNHIVFAELISKHQFNYSGGKQKEISVDALNNLLGFRDDNYRIVNFDGATPQKAATEDKNADGTG